VQSTRNILEGFDPASDFERGETVTLPAGRVVEAVSESKLARNLLRAFYKARPEERAKGSNVDIFRKWHEEELLADWPPSRRATRPKAVN
jgi:hypothetical protein